MENINYAIDAKAKLAFAGIMAMSESLKSSLKTQISSLSGLSGAKEKKLNDILVSFLFLHSNKFFWENIIQDQSEAKEFEKAFHNYFTNSLNFDPRPFMGEMIKYVENVGAQGEIQFLGSKICNDILEAKDGTILMQIISVYSPFHKKLLQACISTWKAADDDVREIKENKTCINESRKGLYSPSAQSVETHNIAWWKIGVVLATVAFLFWLLTHFG